MSLPEGKTFTSGQLTGIAYTFARAGDVLPGHAHDEAGTHITVFARGSFLARGVGWERKHLPGDVIEFIAGQWHEIEALEDNSKLVNVQRLKGG